MSWRLKKLRCDRVEFSVFEHQFCKNILAYLRHHIFHEMELVFLMNILCDINICFIIVLYVNYLVFLLRLKHGGPWLGKLSLSA
jgi:hypothetical protein